MGDPFFYIFYFLYDLFSRKGASFYTLIIAFLIVIVYIVYGIWINKKNKSRIANQQEEPDKIQEKEEDDKSKF